MENHWPLQPGTNPQRAQLIWFIRTGGYPQATELALLGQEPLADLDGLDLVPTEWLHITTLIAGVVDADEDFGGAGGDFDGQGSAGLAGTAVGDGVADQYRPELRLPTLSRSTQATNWLPSRTRRPLFGVLTMVPTPPRRRASLSRLRAVKPLPAWPWLSMSRTSGPGRSVATATLARGWRRDSLRHWVVDECPAAPGRREGRCPRWRRPGRHRRGWLGQLRGSLLSYVASGGQVTRVRPSPLSPDPGVADRRSALGG